MATVDDYLYKKENFNKLFENFTVAIQTKDYYDYRDKKYETVYIDIFSKLKVKQGIVDVYASNLYIELHDKVGSEGFFSSSLGPQVIDYEMDELILTYPGENLFEEDWHILFEDQVLEAVRNSIRHYSGIDTGGKERNYKFSATELWVVE